MDSLTVRWYSHLPAVNIGALANVPMGPGQLVHLDFESWLALDGTFKQSHLKYERNRPLFFIGEAEINADSVEDAFEQLRHFNMILYWAFLLGSGHYLIPNPQMSGQYFRVEQNGIIYKQNHFGAFEREWIVFRESMSFNYNLEILSGINNHFQFLLDGLGFSESFLIMNGLRTLQFTANPEFCFIKGQLSYFNGFVHCMAALEKMLVPAKENNKYKLNITDAFGKSAAVLTAPDFDNLRPLADYYSEVYRIRSKIIHGKAGSNNYTKQVEDAFMRTRILLSIAILNYIKLKSNDFDLKQIPELLIEAYKNKEVYQHIFSNKNHPIS